MLPKPKHLGPEYGAQFQDHAVVVAYHHRPPYPAAVFDILTGLVGEAPGAVLDIGCGTGDVARPLATRLARVDALDISPAMIVRGRHLPGGDQPHLRWIIGRAEDAPLSPPYALVTAGESLHWMEWDVVLPRLRDLLTPEGVLAVVGRGVRPLPWAADLQGLITRYTTNRDYQPYDTIAELIRRGLFTQAGLQETAPVPFTQSVESYIESIHSRNGFSRDRMPAADAAAFDAAVRALLAPVCPDGLVTLDIVGEVCWGRPGPQA